MYLWIKALHVIAIIAWMAGLLYLPRLFVYHAQVGSGPQAELFKVMERRLLRYIMTPAMIVAWAAGLYLIFAGDWLHAPWLHAKVALVLLLSAAHGHDAMLVKRFSRDENRHTDRYYRVINEIPTLLMIGVVILVVVKPF